MDGWSGGGLDGRTACSKKEKTVNEKREGEIIMPGFTIPGVAGIRQSGANLTSQAGRIATQTAGNLGNIQLTIARAKAAGIVEGSRGFSQMLNRLGVTAQQYPLIKQRMEDQALQRRWLQQTNEIRGMQLEKAKADKLELEVSSLVAGEGLTDLTAISARFKELGQPEYGDRYIKTINDRVASLRAAEKATTDKWLADSKALLQILGPYVNKPEWKDVTEKRAAFQEVLKNGARFGLDVSQLGSEPTVFVDDLLMVAHQQGLSVEQQYKLFGEPTLKKRLEEEGAAMDHISRVFGSIKTDQRWQRELKHSELILPPEYLERIPEFYSPEAVAIVKSLAAEKPPTSRPSAELQGYNEARRQEPGLTFREFQRRQKETAPIPGRDVVLPADVAQQRMAISRAGQGGPLKPSDARAILKMIQDVAEAEAVGFNKELRGKPITELKEIIARQEGWNLEELRGIAAGRGRAGGESQGEVTAVNPQTGEKLVLRNGRWVTQ